MEIQVLLKEIQSNKFKPLYVLHGEEPYFIDRIEQAIIKHAIPEDQKDFNQTILYGKDCDLLSVISEAKSYPFMGDRKLVVVREAQNLKDIYDLEKQLDQLNTQNILVISHKYKALDGKKKLVKDAPKTGIVFKSEKVREYQLDKWIQNYVTEIKYDITPKASLLLAQFLGNDLSRIVNELEKLSIVLEKGTRISEVHIEENIGISKEYNVFELNDAILKRNVLKVFEIADYFSKNPKDNPLVMIIPQLFRLHTQLMRIHFAPQKNENILAPVLGLHPFLAKEMIRLSANFNPKILARNVSLLHDYDLKCKGVNNATSSDGDLLRELLFQIMN